MEELLRGLAIAFIGMRGFSKSLAPIEELRRRIAKRREEHCKRFQSLKGKNFRVQRGRKVLRTYKIIDIYGQTRWNGKILFRERVFSKTSIKEHTRVRYQSLDVLENKLGRKVI
jgi:Sec7-like guanine-nucleotide exchange factor